MRNSVGKGPTETSKKNTVSLAAIPARVVERNPPPAYSAIKARERTAAARFRFCSTGESRQAYAAPKRTAGIASQGAAGSAARCQRALPNRTATRARKKREKLIPHRATR